MAVSSTTVIELQLHACNDAATNSPKQQPALLQLQREAVTSAPLGVKQRPTILQGFKLQRDRLHRRPAGTSAVPVDQTAAAVEAGHVRRYGTKAYRRRSMTHRPLILTADVCRSPCPVIDKRGAGSVSAPSFSSQTDGLYLLNQPPAGIQEDSQLDRAEPAGQPSG
ncbi:hypothetical protein EYF80_034486 [Liparis tanakae]|uniref:Uncharacterized protein n=1 Tax=Liparis tanakae TaxID=230148 RepID=A0A4Z2GPA8_9TELE|nr:hypothetical protein EYF80_034486 [Liparis tanakae]